MVHAGLSIFKFPKINKTCYGGRGCLARGPKPAGLLNLNACGLRSSRFFELLIITTKNTEGHEVEIITIFPFFVFFTVNNKFVTDSFFIKKIMVWL